MAPKGDVERFIGRIPLDAWLPGYEATTVGPFQAGLFLRPGPAAGTLHGEIGQWGLIRPGQPQRIDRMPSKVPGKQGRPRSTNNARVEGIEKKATFAAVWKAGRRCLVPAAWYQEPNWETGKNIWWHLKRTDGDPWFIAGLWSEWVDHATGEVVPNFTMLTVNCDDHSMLARLHKPDPELPAGAQDKRSLVHIDADHWSTWLHGTEQEARALLVPQPLGVFDQADALATDAALAAKVEASGATGDLF